MILPGDLFFNDTGTWFIVSVNDFYVFYVYGASIHSFRKEWFVDWANDSAERLNR